MATICLDKLINLNVKPKYGFLSSNNYEYKKILKIKWLYGKENLKDRINGCINNNDISLQKIGEKIDDQTIIYLILCANTNYNFINKIFISEKFLGLVI